MTYEDFIVTRIIYITCVRIVLQLYPHETTKFIESKSKDFYKLVVTHNPYIDNK